MTREELKRHCEQQVESCEKWAKYAGEEPHGKVYEEHKLILELLEQEPCEDYVSRQAVIEGINNYIEKAQSTGTKDDFISFEELVVKALPSIYPKTDVLDKIRAEIELKEKTLTDKYGQQKYGVWTDDVLQIIDKYKADKKDKE